MDTFLACDLGWQVGRGPGAQSFPPAAVVRIWHINDNLVEILTCDLSLQVGRGQGGVTFWYLSRFIPEAFIDTNTAAIYAPPKRPGSAYICLKRASCGRRDVANGRGAQSLPSAAVEPMRHIKDNLVEILT